MFDFLNNGYVGFDGSGTDNGFVKKIIPGLSTDLNDFANGFTSDFEQSNSGRQGYRDKFFSAFAQDDFEGPLEPDPQSRLALGIQRPADRSARPDRGLPSRDR